MSAPRLRKSVFFNALFEATYGTADRRQSKSVAPELQTSASAADAVETLIGKKRIFRNLAKGRQSVHLRNVFDIGELLSEQLPWCSGIVTLYAAGYLGAVVVLLNELPRRGFTRPQLEHFWDDMYLITMPNHADSVLLPPSFKTGTRMTIGAALLRGAIGIDECVALLDRETHDKSIGIDLRLRTEKRNSFRLDAALAKHLRLTFDAWARTSRTCPPGSDELGILFLSATIARVSVDRREQFIDKEIFREWLDSEYKVK